MTGVVSGGQYIEKLEMVSEVRGQDASLYSGTEDLLQKAAHGRSRPDGIYMSETRSRARACGGRVCTLGERRSKAQKHWFVSKL